MVAAVCRAPGGTHDLCSLFPYYDRVALNRRVGGRVGQMIAVPQQLAAPPFAACEADDAPTILAEGATVTK